MITSAALIMVFVFSSFVLNGNAIVKQFGVGLAAAIAIDATIVRCLAVPAAMALFGKAAWWLPRRLDRVLPRISIEGEDYFDQRDREGVAVTFSSSVAAARCSQRRAERRARAVPGSCWWASRRAYPGTGRRHPLAGRRGASRGGSRRCAAAGWRSSSRAPG